MQKREHTENIGKWNGRRKNERVETNMKENERE